MQYYFNELDPTQFQRLFNAIPVSRYGDNVRLTPLRGSDGGRDGETAPGNPFAPFIVDITNTDETTDVFQPGRYMFQVKHHNTNDGKNSDIRSAVVADFDKELKHNVLPQIGDQRVNFFYLITNVPSSESAINAIDKKRRALLTGQL